MMNAFSHDYIPCASCRVCPAHLPRVAAVYDDPVQHPEDPLSRDIQVDFYRQRFTVKIVHHIEGPEASAADQRIVHKIDGPALRPVVYCPYSVFSS